MHHDEVVNEIAWTHGCGIGNVLLSWGVMRGWSVVPNSMNEERIKSNLQRNMLISEEELHKIDALRRKKGRRFTLLNSEFTGN